MKDDLGDRMKGNYEDRTRYLLPRRTYTIIRLDGKAFHTYTRGLNKPFDDALSEDIDNAIIAIMPQIQGAKFAYTQSDEISILLTDFDDVKTDAWFDGNLQKMCSVSASLMTAHFNRERMMRAIEQDIATPMLAYFDSRVFTIPDVHEVVNYFIWRNQDCARNSLSMVAQSLCSHQELQGAGWQQQHELIHQKGKNWATDYTDGQKNGRLIVKESYLAPNPINSELQVERSRWISIPAWKFTEDRDKLLDYVMP